ncbi:MAG: hypothetical protein H9802_12825 [Candidatus Phocaeicola faecipullorum]|nr:hypothetical protein [Candidatus Phocaeicola faecipullorum]
MCHKDATVRQRARRFRRPLVERAERIVIDVSIGTSEQLGYGRVVLKTVDVLLILAVKMPGKW